MTIGQEKLLRKAIDGLIPRTTAVESEGKPVTTKSLAQDGGLEELLKQIKGVGSLDYSLLTLGATGQTVSDPIQRMDSNPQVFLGNAQQKKGGEKPLLIPDLVSTLYNDSTCEEEHDLGGPFGAKIVFRAARLSKLKLENISLSMWVAANARIMHELVQKGKLTETCQISDYLSYTVRIAEPLESHTLASVVLYDNEYRKLQNTYGFRWGSDSQLLHTRLLIKRRVVHQPNNSSQTKLTATNSRSTTNSQPQSICRQFNSLSGCHWPNCRFHHICIVAICNQPHPQHQHPTMKHNA